MQLARTILTALLLLLPAGLAFAAGPAIGIVGPMTGPSEILGRQVSDGVHIAAGALATLTAADDGCTADSGRAAAARLIAAKVRVVVGFLCSETIEAAMPALKDAGIPVITVGVRTDSLTDRRKKTGWPVFRLAPRADGERAAAAKILTELWRTELFAIVDDGTIYGRELAESFRLAAEQSGLQPVFIDTYRPQLDNQIGLVGRLRKAEATHVFVGGDREDIALIGRDAKALDVPLVVAGGENLRSAPGEVPLAPGTLMIGLPEWAEVAAPEAVAKVRAANAYPEGYVLPAFAATELALQAVAAADASGGSVADALSARTFRTSLGPIRFDENGDLSESPYRLFEYDGKKFVPMAGQ
jgi:branched-chain amino acid transport system substrate-binding protein